MSGYKDFADGQFLTGDTVDEYLMRQSVMRFSLTDQITTELATVAEPGMLAYSADTGILYMFNGTAWQPQSSDWQTYSGAFSAGGTNVTVGNSTVISRWRYSGGQVEVFYKFVVGSTANMQSGAYAWALPKTIESSEVQYSIIGQGLFFDASATSTVAAYPMSVFATNSTNCVMVHGANVRTATTLPVQVASGDYYSFRLRYRCVSDELVA